MFLKQISIKLSKQRFQKLKTNCLNENKLKRTYILNNQNQQQNRLIHQNKRVILYNMTNNNIEKDNLYRLIENEFWLLYKHFPNDTIDSLKDNACANYIYDILNKQFTNNQVYKFTLNDIENRIHNIRNYRKQLKYLLDIPQVQQRSPEWYELRKERLTASATAQAIGKGKFGNRNQLLQSKAFPENDKWLPNTSGPMYHGTMLEPMTSRCYSQRNNDIFIHDFGMIKHPHLSCYGASPDGITEMGIMIEIKTPYRRQVDGNIREEYLLQMQGQMAACGFSECEFVDCKIDILFNETTYMNEVNGNVDHGIIIEHRDTIGNPTFNYSPPYLNAKECIEWKNKYNEPYTKIVYWKLYKIIPTRVYFDEKLWNDLVPQIELFWKDVLSLRSEGNKKLLKDTDIKSSKKTKYDFIDSDDE